MQFSASWAFHNILQLGRVGSPICLSGLGHTGGDGSCLLTLSHSALWVSQHSLSCLKTCTQKDFAWGLQSPGERNWREGQEPVSFGLWRTSSRITPQAVEAKPRKRRDRRYWSRLKLLYSSSVVCCLSGSVGWFLNPRSSKKLIRRHSVRIRARVRGWGSEERIGEESGMPIAHIILVKKTHSFTLWYPRCPLC